MRQRVDARDRETEIGIELVGDPESIGLKAEPKQPTIAGEGVPRVENREALQILGGYRHLAEALGVCSDQAHDPTCRAVRLHGFHPHRLVEKRADEDLTNANCGRFFHHGARGIITHLLLLARAAVAAVVSTGIAMLGNSPTDPYRWYGAEFSYRKMVWDLSRVRKSTLYSPERHRGYNL